MNKICGLLFSLVGIALVVLSFWEPGFGPKYMAGMLNLIAGFILSKE